MSRSSSKRLAPLLLVALFCGVMLVYLNGPTKAQYVDNSFIALLRPLANKEVRVTTGVGKVFPATIVEVGADYIVFEDSQNTRTAVPSFQVSSIRYDEVPLIHLNY